MFSHNLSPFLTLQISVCVYSVAVREFLCLDEPPGPFDSLEESRVRHLQFTHFVTNGAVYARLIVNYIPIICLFCNMLSQLLIRAVQLAGYAWLETHRGIRKPQLLACPCHCCAKNGPSFTLCMWCPGKPVQSYWSSLTKSSSALCKRLLRACKLKATEHHRNTHKPNRVFFSWSSAYCLIVWLKKG